MKTPCLWNVIGGFLVGFYVHQKRKRVCKPPTFGRQPKDNSGFVVTNLKTTPRHVYEAVYCARGDVENRLKELKLGLEIDRTSCMPFLANQFAGACGPLPPMC